jgi:hypothetical protein
MNYKKQRIGTKLLRAARAGERYRDIHVFIGGTGAIGGTALLQILSMYEEMMSIRPPAVDDVPILVTTGRTAEELHAFTRRLFRFIESRDGISKRPERVASGYITRSGIFIALERFQLTALPGLEEVTDTPESERPKFARDFLSKLNAESSPLDTLMQAISTHRPISSFLQAYQSKHFKNAEPVRFRSVVIGIPIPSLLAYHLGHLRDVARYIGGFGEDKLEELHAAFRHAFRDDLNEVKTSLAEEVLVAHTTAVGGMYDEDIEDGRLRKKIRLGFAHSAQDSKLIIKQHEAEEFAREYAAVGIKMLVTAAAVGIDEVRIRSEVPLHFQIAQKLKEAPEELFPGSKRTLPARAKAGNEVDRPVPVRQVIKVHNPITMPLDSPPRLPARFAKGITLRPAYSIRSGENGFFTVSNADALYRVMRIASASELGLVLATVGLFGDDPISPWFDSNVCYYTETDNSRQVFDLLNQPPLLRAQLSGLEPLALQDLGSSKHQGELHTLSLIILLHRLRTLDTDAIDPYADFEHFDPSHFFVEHSRPLLFEDLETWHVETLSREMQIMASAEKASDLLALIPSRYRSGLFPFRDKALHRILERVLQAVWMIPSLGSPLIFERDGVTFVRTGYFAAPLDLLVTEQNSINDRLSENYKRHLEDGYEDEENYCSFEEFRDFHLCVGGFVDLRPTAILCTAEHSEMALRGRVKRLSGEEELRAELLKLEPYSFFTTSGLTALTLRLRALHRLLQEAMVELGTLHEFRWQMPRDLNGHILLVPGVVEAFRMFSEGLEKTTGTERLSGLWGYERRSAPDRLRDIPGLNL